MRSSFGWRTGPDQSEPAPLPGGTQLAAAALLFAIATIALSYPLAFEASTLSRLDNGDARLNAWAISWVAHQLSNDPLSLFDANTFYPLENTLAYSEHLTLLGAFALPLLAITDDLVLTNNLLLLFSMFATALGMYLLAFTLTRDHHAALLAGVVFSFAPFRFNRLPHLQIQLYAFIPLMLAGLHRFLMTKRLPWLALAASAFVLQALAGTYLGAIGAVALAVGLVTLIPRSSMSWRDVSWLALAFAAAAAVLVPFALPYLWVNETLGVEWDLGGLSSLSATPQAYLASSTHLHRGWTEALTTPEGRTDYLFPGVTLIAFGAIGAGAWLRSRETRSIALCYGAILATGVVLSLGPMTPVYPFLYENVVFFRGLRALTRFGLLPLLSLSVFSAAGAALLLSRVERINAKRAVAAAIGLFFAIESSALPYRLEPHRDEPPEVYQWLAQQEPGPFVELPFKVVDTRYMFWARHHRFRPTLNGDSGFIPMSHQWMKVVLGRFPSSDALSLLQRLEVRYVVVHLGAFRPRALTRLLTGLKEVTETLVPIRDFGGQVVYEVVPSTRPVATLRDWQVLSAQHGDGDPLVFDGSTLQPIESESADVEMDITLSARAVVNGLRLHYGPEPKTPVARAEILLEDEHGGYRVVWKSDPDWPAVSQLVMGLLSTPLDGTQDLELGPLTTDRFRLRLRGIDNRPPDVTEIAVYGTPQKISVRDRTPGIGEPARSPSTDRGRERDGCPHSP